VIVDPGPSSSVETLIDRLGATKPRALLLTHIHLDHAGATGKLVERWPDLEVWVHERGARHVVDPSKLVASATRIYGDDMERLWGEIVPVPEGNLRVLAGGETDGPWRVAYTPGHAWHHVSYLHEPTGTAFVGDTGGVRIPTDGPIMPPTPPPDIDLATWRESIDLIAGWRPSRLAVTHFGAWEDVAEHLAGLRTALSLAEGWARDLADADAYGERVRAEIAAVASPETAAEYEQAMPAETLYPGLERALQRVASSSE
jgi:glyoxylase-like metal-dependent hydrolase (beta-lactamase superfamily II)